MELWRQIRGTEPTLEDSDKTGWVGGPDPTVSIRAPHSSQGSSFSRVVGRCCLLALVNG